ncbi:MAG: rhodanese-like domain-containing protein [Gammaproteobacteria bacterium]
MKASLASAAIVMVLMCSVASERETAAQNSFGEATRQAPPQQQPQSAPPARTQQPPTTPQVPVGGFRPSAPAAPPAQQGANNGGILDTLMAAERQDFGVAPVSTLHAGQMHGPTPSSIPGGQLITTKGLVELLRGGQAPVLTLDILGGAEMIQGAVYAVPAAQSGSFTDETQQQFGKFLQQATAGNKRHPIVMYCLSPECWMSYNASLRAINLGYTNVLWYRGGIDSWKKAGLPVQSAGSPQGAGR